MKKNILNRHKKYIHVAFIAVVVLIIAIGLRLLPSFSHSSSPSSPEDAELRSRLTDLQYYVTQQDGTEPPFNNEYWDNHEPGIYVDVVSGEALFSSTDKFDSDTGWPSFTKPIAENVIVHHTDFKLGYPRDEVKSAGADSHLGHVFKDGPPPAFDRYCINSAALRFIPLEELEQVGYDEYLHLFTK